MRKCYLDNIRWITVCIVALYHVIFMYNGIVSVGTVGAFHQNQWQDGIMYLLYPWFMVLLFIVAGMCSRYYLEKHKIKEFRSWYEAMPLYYKDERFQCVHACLKDEDPAKNDPETLIWGRDTDYSGKLVLTGHTPYKIPLYFNGSDPMGVINEGVWGRLPETGMIALDTGCVYGNRLTGMVIEDDRFIIESVPSRIPSKR